MHPAVLDRAGHVARADDRRPAPARPPATPLDARRPPAPTKRRARVDLDELYEYFLERFKRDLLVEREQFGHLLIDNP